MQPFLSGIRDTEINFACNCSCCRKHIHFWPWNVTMLSQFCTDLFGCNVMPFYLGVEAVHTQGHGTLFLSSKRNIFVSHRDFLFYISFFCTRHSLYLILQLLYYILFNHLQLLSQHFLLFSLLFSLLYFLSGRSPIRSSWIMARIVALDSLN